MNLAAVTYSGDPIGVLIFVGILLLIVVLILRILDHI